MWLGQRSIQYQNCKACAEILKMFLSRKLNVLWEKGASFREQLRNNTRQIEFLNTKEQWIITLTNYPYPKRLNSATVSIAANALTIKLSVWDSNTAGAIAMKTFTLLARSWLIINPAKAWVVPFIWLVNELCSRILPLNVQYRKEFCCLFLEERNWFALVSQKMPCHPS